ncbi:MAG: serine protease [Patescibacteria group bacterium]|nr:serine protease [Patescibacteria group bacterium]
MKISVKPSRRERRLFFILGAAFFLLLATVFLRHVVVSEESRARQAAETDLRLQQRLLAKRLAQVEENDANDRRSLMEALDNNSLSSGNVGGLKANAPFAAEKIIGAVAELICVDNVNRETLYTASGVVIDPAGVIVTNQHNLRSRDNSLIRICGVGFTDDLQKSPKIEYVAVTSALHKTADLAIIRITDRLDGGALPDEFPALSLKESAEAARVLNLGDAIYIGGYPSLGADTFTFTAGVVSGRVGAELIKTSALIDAGTSGGAAFDAAGRYVGMPTAAAKGEIGGSLGYLISAEVVTKFLDDYYALKASIPDNAGGQ